MNFISVNIQGMGNSDKITWLRKQCDKHKINVLVIQEMKVSSMELAVVRS